MTSSTRVHRAEPAGPARRARGGRGGRGGLGDRLIAPMGARRLARQRWSLCWSPGAAARPGANRSPSEHATTPNRRCWPTCTRRHYGLYGTAAHVESVPDPLAGLDSGAIGVVPGFTGRLLDTFAPGARARAAAQVYRDMVSALPEGVAAGDYAESAEDKPALAVTEATVDAWGGRDVTAAVRNCEQAQGRTCRRRAATGRHRDVHRQMYADIPTAQRCSRRCGPGR